MKFRFLLKFVILYMFINIAAILSLDVEEDQYDFEPIEESIMSNQTSDFEKVRHQVRFFVNSTPALKGANPEIKIGRFSTLRKTNFHKNSPVKILIHGFMGECSGDNFPNRIISAYRDGKNTSRHYNLICVDWGPLSNQGGQVSLLLYRLAVDNTILVGKRIAEFVKYLIDNNLTSLTNIHLIGFSLGAHVAGTTGYFIEKLYKEKVGRITGLDPAGPFFAEEKQVEHKLDQSDAKFVDIIHTNAGKLGISKSIGHVDFYPNGGRRQPQCEQTGDPAIDFQEAVAGVCSHYMAPKYFALSILEPQRIGCKCSTWKDLKEASCQCTEYARFGENCKASFR